MNTAKIVKYCDAIIEYGFLVIVFFIPIIFDFSISSYNLVDLYKMIVFRVILTVILLAYVLKIFIENKLSYRGGRLIFFLTAGLGLSFFLSSLFSLLPHQSFWGGFFRQQGFYNYFHYLLFFVLLILNLKEFKQVKRIIIAVVSSATLVSGYGLIQFFGLDPLYWTENPIITGRIFSTLGQPNFLGHYLILVLPIGFYALIFLARRFWVRFLIGLAVFMQLVSLAMTYSRAAWISLLGSMALLFLFWLVYTRRKKLALGFTGLMLIGLITVIGLNVLKFSDQNDLYSMNFVNRLKTMVNFGGGSGKMRLYYIESAVTEIKNTSPLRLLVGFGPETLAEVFTKYYKIDWGIYEAVNTVPDRAHNWFLDQVLTLGVIGLVATLTFYVYFIYKAAGYLFSKNKLGHEDWLLAFLSSSLVAYFINNLFSFSLFTILVYLHLILALAWFIISSGKEKKEVNLKLTFFSRALIWAALLVVAAIFIWTNNLNQARAEINYVKAVKATKHSTCPEVEKRMERAISFSPGSDYYRVNYVYLMLNCFPLAKDRVAREQMRDNLIGQIEAIENKQSYEVLDNQARLYTLFGLYLDKAYYPEAEKIFNSLIKNHPYTITAFEDLARLKMAQDDYSGAAEIYERTLKILPPLDHPYLNPVHRAQINLYGVRINEALGQVYFLMKKYDLALQAFEDGLKFDPARATIYKKIADIFYVQGKLDQAIAWNKRGLMLNPADYNWPLALSFLYRDKKDLTQARAYLDQALKLAPENQDLKKYYEELNDKKLKM